MEQQNELWRRAWKGAQNMKVSAIFSGLSSQLSLNGHLQESWANKMEVVEVNEIRKFCFSKATAWGSEKLLHPRWFLKIYSGLSPNQQIHVKRQPLVCHLMQSRVSTEHWLNKSSKETRNGTHRRSSSRWGWCSAQSEALWCSGCAPASAVIPVKETTNQLQVRSRVHGQFKHQMLFATQTQTQPNLIVNINLMCRICHTLISHWLRNLGYEALLQLTFAA